MVRFFSSLRFRLMLLVLLALLPSWGLVIYTAEEQRHSAAKQAEEYALQIARDASQHLLDLIESTHQFLSVLAQLPAVRDVKPETCNEFLAEFLERYPHYTSITIRATKDNTSLCRATPKNGPIPAEPGLAHIRALEARDFAVGDFQIGKTSGKAVLPFGYPIRDNTGQIQAVLMVALDLDVLNQVATQALLPAGSSLLIIDNTGRVLARYPDPGRWVGKSGEEVPVVKAILAQQGEGTVEATGMDGILRLNAFTPLADIATDNVYVSVGIPSKVAYAEVNQILTRNLVTLAIVAMLALGAVWLIGDLFLLRQVDRLVNVAGHLAKGDLHARVGPHLSVDELRKLALAFDELGESLQQQETERKQTEEQTRRWSAGLEQLLNALSDAISQSLEVSKTAEIALTRTLRMMELSEGGVFLKHRGKLELVAKMGLRDKIIRDIQQAQPCNQAPDDLQGMTQAESVEIFAAEIAGQTTVAGNELKSWIRVPIKSKGRGLGVMCLTCERNRLLKTYEKWVLATVGQQIGVAIENAELHEQVQSVAALQERERISRELHDGLAQVLGYLSLQIEVTRDLVKTGQIGRSLDELQGIQCAVQQAHQDLRESILGLRTTIHPQGGLFSSLKEYLHKFELQTGIPVNLVSNGKERIEFSPEAEVQLLRIIQEALTNIRKHSGAKRAWVRFESGPIYAHVLIQDDGIGFDPIVVGQSERTIFGLQTMRERAESVGGILEISSQPEQGTQISVDLPMRRGGNVDDSTWKIARTPGR